MAKTTKKDSIADDPVRHVSVGTGKLLVGAKGLTLPSRPILKTPETSHDNSCGSNNRRQLNREVSFDSVTIRKYPMELGDHPSVSVGAPVSLAWEHDEEDTLDLDVYECERGFPRKLRHLVLSYYRRQDILRNAGYSDHEIRKATKDVSKTQRQRGRTRLFSPVAKLEDVACSAVRKMKRLVANAENTR